jgi:hypothetical protein
MDDEDWKAYHQFMVARSKVHRANNRQSSTHLLVEEGIPFETRNKGAHLIVYQGAVRIDFWPGTGLWCVRGTKHYKRGVRLLIKELKHDN